MAHVRKRKIDEFKSPPSAFSDACKRYVNSLHYHLYLWLKRIKINCFVNASSVGNAKTHRCFFKKHVFVQMNNAVSTISHCEFHWETIAFLLKPQH